MDALPEVLQRCQQLALRKPPRLMSHLACAHDPDHPGNPTQHQRFAQLAEQAPELEASLANSAALLNTHHNDCRHHWVRPGLALYGISPFLDHTGNDHGLQAVMSLESELIAVRQLAAGEAVGYSATWRTPEPMAVGIVAIGYADGYPRHAPSGTPVLVNGKRCALAGKASMDMLAVDLRNCPTARSGAPVQLWGDQLPVEQVAAMANTIPYELLCGVRKHKRLHYHLD